MATGKRQHNSTGKFLVVVQVTKLSCRRSFVEHVDILHFLSTCYGYKNCYKNCFSKFSFTIWSVMIVNAGTAKQLSYLRWLSAYKQEAANLLGVTKKYIWRLVGFAALRFMITIASLLALTNLVSFLSLLSPQFLAVWMTAQNLQGLCVKDSIAMQTSKRCPRFSFDFRCRQRIFRSGSSV